MAAIVPADSRYIPFTQQPSCCVPTCVQMVMYKCGIPLLPAEEIGYHMGLVVRPDRSMLFYNARTAETPPLAGYGTRLYLPEFEPNAALSKLKIPLRVNTQLIPAFATPAQLLKTLAQIEAKDGNALLCFNHGALLDDPEMNWGHVVVFDRVIGKDKLRIVDSSPQHPKWRTVDITKMFAAMQQHGEERLAGVWVLEKI
jgi:hypothetical protein